MALDLFENTDGAVESGDPHSHGHTLFWAEDMSDGNHAARAASDWAWCGHKGALSQRVAVANDTRRDTALQVEACKPFLPNTQELVPSAIKMNKSCHLQW